MAVTLPPIFSKISTIWASIGTLLIVFGANGASVPQFILNIFSQATVDAVTIFLGAAITFYQYLRTLKGATAEVKSASSPTIGHFLNPFKAF